VPKPSYYSYKEFTWLDNTVYLPLLVREITSP